MLARLLTDGFGDRGFNGDETLGEKLWRYGVASSDAGLGVVVASSVADSKGLSVIAGSSPVDSKDAVETLAGAVDPFALHGLLLAVPRKAAEAISALRAVVERPCCCNPSS